MVQELLGHRNISTTKKYLGKGIIPIHCGESALHPDSNFLSYTMSFEKVSLPAVVLQKLLETKPQADSERHEETHE